MTYNIPEQLIASNQSYIEHLLAVGRVVFDCAEKLSSFNVNMSRSLLEDRVSSGKAWLSINDWEAFLEGNKMRGQASAEKWATYWQGLYKIEVQAQADLSAIVETEYAKLTTDFCDVLDKAVQTGAPGSDGAIAAVKAAIAARNSAYEGINQAARHVAETTESNLAAILGATTANKASPKARKVASA